MRIVKVLGLAYWNNCVSTRSFPIAELRVFQKHGLLQDVTNNLLDKSESDANTRYRVFWLTEKGLQAYKKTADYKNPKNIYH